ncbi:hypothetical protein PCANC_12476 [Puccinia coronata f. sp. avenae]|uniref:Uncharacterized protein n=1 Tax=Puccinia coronata f. sp. avenae TaxID=200324 RepID=A0A2N5UL37_9BASI|nr:hypothetical protein PCANC_12476 [Puccinia coronata f. sp. avenae]
MNVNNPVGTHPFAQIPYQTVKFIISLFYTNYGTSQPRECVGLLFKPTRKNSVKTSQMLKSQTHSLGHQPLLKSVNLKLEPLARERTRKSLRQR